MASNADPVDPEPGASPADEPDSVDLELNGVFESPVLERVREFQRPAWMRRRKPKVLDPLEDYTEWEHSGLPYPPDAWDTIAEAILEEDAELEQAKNIPPPHPQFKEEVVYRRRLVNGTTPKDLTWLKLKAYHRGMDTLQAMREAPANPPAHHVLQQQQQSARSPPSSSSSSPLDHNSAAAAAYTHPSSSSSAAAGSSGTPSTSHQEQQRQAYSSHINANVAAAAAAASVSRIRHLLQIEYSEDSEWAAEWSSTSYLDPPPFRNFTQARLAEREQFAAAEEAAEFEQRHLEQQLEIRSARRTIYTPEFLQEKALLDKAAQQQRQRSGVFWASMGVAVAVYGLRWAKRRLFKGGPPAAGSRRKDKPQAA